MSEACVLRGGCVCWRDLSMGGSGVVFGCKSVFWIDTEGNWELNDFYYVYGRGGSLK